jgi:hypothetical protein
MMLFKAEDAEGSFYMEAGCRHYVICNKDSLDNGKRLVVAAP